MNTLVVAKHKEDVRWIVELREQLPHWRPMVVAKGRDVPNEGREAGSYLWAIQRLYPRLRTDDQIAFVQGNPFDHCPALFEELMDPTLGFSPLGTWRCRSDAHGGPDHPGLPVGEKYEEWLERPFPGHVDFTAGAQFLVKGKNLLRHPAEKYESLYPLVCEANGPWVMERLWEGLLA